MVVEEQVQAQSITINKGMRNFTDKNFVLTKTTFEVKIAWRIPAVCLHMLAKNVRACKCRQTNATHKRFLTSVRAHVSLQIASLTESC